VSDALASAIAEARRAWPDVDVPEDAFSAYVSVRVDDASSASLSDLWLACAVTRGDAAAVRAFDDVLRSELPSAIAHLDGGTALLDDVTGAVRERVLGVDGTSGKLGDYRGRGSLRGWLRAVGVREALQLIRRRRREAPLPADAELARHVDEAAGATELSERERGIYREAFGAALASLTARDRNLLRQHYLYATTIDALGALHGVHRATAARWIADIRETLLERTRQRIGAALQLAGADLDSVMGRLAGHLDVSLRQTLSFER
jgi:RNA polymerase sigma-70 factor (ECF subfamily)